MPGIGLPGGGIRSTPARALLWGGVGILVVTLAFAVTWSRQASVSFDHPVEVEATVVEDGYVRSGGATAARCQPLLRYEVDGTTHEARPPTHDAAACASVGDSVTIAVDAQDPERIAVPVAERSVASALVAALGLGAAMTVTGLVLHARDRRRSQTSGPDASAGESGPGATSRPQGDR